MHKESGKVNVRSYFSSSRKPGKLSRHLLAFKNQVLVNLMWALKVQLRRRRRIAPVVVSLTSYPQRYETLGLTIKSLLLQSVRPEKLILWISHEDAKQLPRGVKVLAEHGLEIRHCEDMKSFKKIVPTMQAFPDSDIVTADDDIYYWPTWLEELVIAANEHPGDIIGHRVHEITTDENGGIRPYRQWNFLRNNTERSERNFATGIAGVFYPAGCFHPDVLDQTEFRRLCPDADDVWLYWMVRMNGRFERHSGTRKQPIPWRGSQKSALWKSNKYANDQQIQSMTYRYGLPWR